MNVWLIYLISLTEPKQAVITAISTDSVYFYHHVYHTEKILHEEEKRLYVFNGGYLFVKNKRVKFEFFDGEKITYKITRQVHEYKKK